MPSVSKDRVNLAPSARHKFFQSPAMVIYCPMALFFVMQTLSDSFSPYASIFGVVGGAMLIIGGYQRMKALRVPLWLTKEVTKYSVVAIFTFLILGYGTLARHKSFVEMQQIMHKLQRENDKDLKAFMEQHDPASSLALAKQMNNDALVHQMEAERQMHEDLKRLKNPFL